MDFFGRGICSQEKGLKVPGTWIRCTPAKPIPTRAHTIIGETNGGGRPNWRESMGMGFPPNFVRVNPNVAAATLNLTPSFDQRVDYNNWESALSMKEPEPTIEAYAQGMNDVNPMSMWNNLSFTDLLALANAASGVLTASASSKQRQGNNATTNCHVFPFSLPENDNNQLQFNSANMFAEQNYSISSNMRNISNHPQQMPQ